MLEDRPDRDLDVIRPFRKGDRGLSALRYGHRGDDIGVSVAEIGIHCANSEHPRAAQKVGTQQLLGGIRVWKWVRMGVDRAGPGDVLLEMLKRGRWQREAPNEEIRLATPSIHVSDHLLVVVDRF